MKLNKLQVGGLVASVFGGLCTLAGLYFEKADAANRDKELAKDIAEMVVKMQREGS